MSSGYIIKKRNNIIMKIVKNDLADEGAIRVAAVGNCGLYACQFAHPARLKNATAVGGLTKCGHKLCTPGKKIDMYAPPGHGEAVSS